jgi:heme A synthase
VDSGESAKSVNSGRVRQIRLWTRIILVLLTVQFLLGMWTNLFVSFPDVLAGTNPFAQIFTNGLYVLAAHLILGFALFGVAIATFVLSFQAKIKVLVRSSVTGLAMITIAGVSGLIFVLSEFQSDPFSYLMAVFFLFAFGSYYQEFLEASLTMSR